MSPPDGVKPPVLPPQPQETVHEVEANETLTEIGQPYGLDAQQIAERNKLDKPDQISPGDTLILPTTKQHPEPVAPAQTPEQAKVDTTLKDHLLAQDNLAAMQSTSGQNGNAAWPADQIAAQQQLVFGSRDKVETAVADAIRADLQADGKPIDAANIQQYGDALAQRYANDPAALAAVKAAVTETKTDQEVQTALADASAKPDARGVIESLNGALPKLSPEAQTKLLESREFADLIDTRVMPDVIAPIKDGVPESSYNGAAEALDSLTRLEKIAAGADTRITQALAEREIAALEKAGYKDDGYGEGYIGIEGTNALVRLAGSLDSSSERGSLLIDRMAELKLDTTQIHMAIAEGASPDLPLAIAARVGGPDSENRVLQSTLQGVQMYANSLKGDVDKLAKETEELNWLINNAGASMTPQQLDQAIKQYIADKGPDWEKKVQGMEDKIAADGLKLLDQFDTLRLSGRMDAVNGTIEKILGDQSSRYAISMALNKHPEYVDTQAGKRLMQNLAYGAKGGEQFLKLGKEFANAYVRNNVLSAAQGYDVRNPASIAKAEAAIERLKDPTFAKLIGIDLEGSKFKTYTDLVDNLKKTLPAAGDTTQDIVQKLKLHADTMNHLNDKLTHEGAKPAFDKNQPAGQILRTVGLGFATVGFLNAVGKANDGQFSLTDRNDLNAIVQAAGLGQKGTELALGMGLVAENSTLGRFGAGNRANDGTALDQGRLTRADRVFGLLSAGFDAWAAVDSFRGANGAAPDPVKGGLYAASAAGGTLAALSGTSFAASLGIGAWAGPVGIGLVAVATLGLTIKDRVDHSNLHMNDTSAKFLQNANLDPDTAKALVDQSGEGWSPVTLLAQYAQNKGYDLSDPAQQAQFAKWLNDMPLDQLEHVRDWAHHTLDEFDGDVTKLGTDKSVVESTGTVNTTTGPVTVMDAPRTVGQIDALIAKYGATPLPTA
ncbi:MAG TPA: LysM peptidoglycan-binding domain-containing protein [Luteimonas sp.]|nr:LysM peptidoglycan-binding domain-containing protein [Luteimonas sp.]